MIPVATRPKAWVYVRSLSATASLNPAGGGGGTDISVVSVVSLQVVQVVVPVTGR